jgi:hypothetical protein
MVVFGILCRDVIPGSRRERDAGALTRFEQLCPMIDVGCPAQN